MNQLGSKFNNDFSKTSTPGNSFYPFFITNIGFNLKKSNFIICKSSATLGHFLGLYLKCDL